jgi:hypothetical protein
MPVPGQLRYRALVQGVKNGRDFNGELQFLLIWCRAENLYDHFPDPKSGKRYR